MQMIKKWLIDGCALYTLISVVYLIIGLSIGNTGISAANFLLILPTALTISIGMQIYQNRKLGKGTRYFLNYVFTVFGVFLFMVIPSDPSRLPMQNFVGLILLSILFWVLFLLYRLIQTRIEKIIKK